VNVVVSGSFDPITLGHMDVISRAVTLFGHVTVGVGFNLGKGYMFDMDTRVAMVRAACEGLDVEVWPMEGLLVDFCAAHDATVVVRGARSGSDFEYEWALARMNASLSPIETVVLPANEVHAYLSSTFVRSVADTGGDISAYVPHGALALMKKES
jgi:pantetheine-phosphate adenylyltransferase